MTPAQTVPTIPLTVSVGVHCHPGNVRAENQDRISRSSTSFGDLYVIADGVGGYQGGAEAAQATVDGFARELTAHAALPLSDALEAAAQAVNRELNDRGQAQNPPVKMSSTVVIALIQGATATVAHIGDSRAYLVRGGQLQQITRDHSVMQRLIDQGVVGADEAEEHPNASMLTQALGQAENVRLEISQLQLLPDDALLLCSDGLWGYTSDAEIEAVTASRALSAEGCADALLQLALQGGGGDNISIQYLRFSARQTPLHRTSIFGARPGAAVLVALGLGVLAAAAAGLVVWNYLHGALPAQARETLGAAALGSGAGPIVNTPTPALVLVSVVRDHGAESQWASRLATLGYVDIAAINGGAACLNLERERDTLYYSPSKEGAASRIQKDLGLSMRDLSQLEVANHACGASELFALPARRPSPDSLQDKAKRAVTSVEDRLKKF